jgi:hypothetical protein
MQVHHNMPRSFHGIAQLRIQLPAIETVLHYQTNLCKVSY